MQQKTNQTGTDSEQMLRDLLKAAGEKGKTGLVAKISDLLTDPAFTKDVATAADQTYNTRQYKNMRFVQATALQENSAPAILCTLSHSELLLYTLLERIATRGQFQIAQSTAGTLLNMSKPTVIKAFKGLLDKHILYLVEPATQHTAAIYRINSNICKAGKDRANKQDLEDLEAVQDWNVLYKRMDTASIQIREATRVLDSGKKQKYVVVDTA